MVAQSLSTSLSNGTLTPGLITGLGQLTNFAVAGDRIFTIDGSTGTIGEYTTSGQTVNASLITGIFRPSGIAVSGGVIYVTSGDTVGAKIETYSISDQLLNPALVTGLNIPTDMAVDGTSLFVMNNGNGTVGDYTTAGATVNARFVGGIGPSGYGLSVANGIVYFTGALQNLGGTYVAAFDETGASRSAFPITTEQIANPVGALGSDIFIAPTNGTVASYNGLTGRLENANLFTLPAGYAGITSIVAVPEPATWLLLSGGGAFFLAGRRSR